jgi:hypothetical protein
VGDAHCVCTSMTAKRKCVYDGFTQLKLQFSTRSKPALDADTFFAQFEYKLTESQRNSKFAKAALQSLDTTPSPSSPPPLCNVNFPPIHEIEAAHRAGRVEPSSCEEMSKRLLQSLNSYEDILLERKGEMVEFAKRVRDSLRKEGYIAWNHPLVPLRTIASIINVMEPNDTSTRKTWEFIDDMFKTMKARDYNSNRLQRIEMYYEPNPAGGYRIIGSTHRNRIANLDHILASHYSIWNHPRFYVMMPAAINKFLQDKHPIWRVAFGMSSSALRLICSDLKLMANTMRERKLYQIVYRSLPNVITTKHANESTRHCNVSVTR